MGYIRSHAIVVTDYGYGDHIDRAHAQATALDLCVTPVTDGKINCVRSFAALPDGSKEGWTDSDQGDEARGAFVAYLRTLYYGDGSSPLSWVEVQFGDDEGLTCVLRSSDGDAAAAAPTGGTP